jgi:predicted CXXCH cytochrome family protein
MAGCSGTTRWWCLAAGLLLGAVVLGCGTPTQRYRTLSFFFDGVPNPDAPKGVSTSTRGNAHGIVTYLHKPFSEKKCESCHQNSEDIFARARVRQDVCMDCHRPVKKQYPCRHGPVGAGHCLMCHSPHQATEPHLLKQQQPGLCTQCHEPAMLSSGTPEHQKADANCLSCHSGHGGTDWHFLKASGRLPATGPSTQESGVSAVKQ